MDKQALISPAIEQAQEGMPTPDGEQQIFEDKFSQMAYQVFNSQFPDLVESIVTFKLLDSDIERGSAVGSFILERNGSFIYVPIVLSDNQLKPLDIMYIKDKDIFLPLDESWVTELEKGGLEALGEGTELPKTVPTDVDIRNITSPPTSAGRYSYASVSPQNKLAADASIPLGQRLHKEAQMPGAMPGAMPPMPMPGQPGQGQQQEFDPNIWAVFVDNYQKIFNSTPGQALDSGAMDVEKLSKMYKGHMKTWEEGPQQMAMEDQQNQMMQSMMPQGPAVPPVGGEQKIAGKEKAYRTVGEALDQLIGTAGAGAAGGAAIGGFRASTDRDVQDVPSAMLRGAVGGAVGAPVGRVIGKAVGHSKMQIDPEIGGGFGAAIGGGLGGYQMARAKPGTLYEPSPEALQAWQAQNQGTPRYASDMSTMFKHVKDAEYNHKPILPDFLTKAPNEVKTAFVQVLQDNPALLKIAGDLYGQTALVDALRPIKKAEVIKKELLQIADNSFTPDDYLAFGEKKAEAYQGVLLRGYYFDDKRPGLKVAAVQTQNHRAFHDTRESGIYQLYKHDGTPTTALVVPLPCDLMDSDRPYFPYDDKKVIRVKTKVPGDTHDKEPESMGKHDLKHPDPDVERSHSLERLVITSDRKTFNTCENILGERVTEDMLKRTPLGRGLLSKGTPKSGYGLFVYKRGEHYIASKPCYLKDIRTSKGIIRGKIDSSGGMYGDNTFSIDYNAAGNRPRRPKGKNTVIIPASWKWVPLKDDDNSRLIANNFISSAKDIDHFITNRTSKNNAQKIAVHYAGENTFSVDGGESLNKTASLKKLAVDYKLHASAAEALLKIAKKEHTCEAWVMTPTQYKNVCDDIKIAEGNLPPETELGGPPAMQEAPPMPPEELPVEEEPPMQEEGSAVENGDPERQQILLEAVEPGLSTMEENEFGDLITAVLEESGEIPVEEAPPEEMPPIEEAPPEEMLPEAKEAQVNVMGSPEQQAVMQRLQSEAPEGHVVNPYIENDRVMGYSRGAPQSHEAHPNAAGQFFAMQKLRSLQQPGQDMSYNIRGPLAKQGSEQTVFYTPTGLVKTAQPPMPPAMQGGAPPPMPPAMQGGEMPPPLSQAQGAPPMPPEEMPPPEMPSATDQAFQETL